MSNLVRLSNDVAVHLAKLHGGNDAATKFRMRAMMAPKPLDGSGVVQRRVVIINDLHIGAGRDPDTNKYHPGDDFTNDQSRQLIAYLVHEWKAATTGNATALHPTRAQVASVLDGLKWDSGEPVDPCRLAAVCQAQKTYGLTLSINGDFVDFLQTTASRAAFPYPDGYERDGVTPKNTPANSIVQLNMIRAGHPEMFRALAVHLRLGHDLELLMGNHDRHFWNDHVWSGEVTSGGRTFGGFTRVIAEELRAIGASDKEISACLGRLTRKAFSAYGDKWIEHGDMGDRFNRVRRPYGELFAPSGLHQEMSMALGDYGVRGGFNSIEVIDPTLDALGNSKNAALHAIRHPIHAAKLFMSFVRGYAKDGYDVSKEADLEQRISDVRALVERFPYLTESLNAMRPEGEKLTKEQVADGMAELERKSSTPLFSNFAKGSGLASRLFTMVAGMITGTVDRRKKNDVYLDRLEVLNEKLGVNEMVHGHTHTAQDDQFITKDEKFVRYVNTHTWMTKVGGWGRPSVTWGENGRGVGVIEVGVDRNGKPWSDLALRKVIDERGSLVEGDLLEDEEGVKKDKTLAGRLKAMHENAIAKEQQAASKTAPAGRSRATRVA